MTQDEFRKLEVGDVVYFPTHGRSKITRVEKTYDFDSGKYPPDEYTWEIECFRGHTIRDGESTVSMLIKVEGGNHG